MKHQNSYLPERFDSFCKKVIKNEALNIQKQRNSLNQKQISFSNLSNSEIIEIYGQTTDDFFSDEFIVLDHKITVKNENLAVMLHHLTHVPRSIMLLSYFVGYSDKEIAKELGIAYWKISYIKKKTLEEMRSLLK